MNLVDRYVLSSFLRVLMWALLAFIAIFILVDLFDHIDNFLDDNAAVSSILKYYLYQLPLIVDQILPIAMMLASLFTMGLLSKNNEYSALLSAGVSLTRITRSLLLFALLMSVVAGLFREHVVAESNRRQADVKKYEIEGKQHETLRGKSNFTYVGKAGRVYVVSRFRPRPPTLETLSIQTFQDSTMVSRIDAERALWRTDHWELEHGTVRSFRNGVESVEPFRTRELTGPTETPEDFSRRQVDPDEMNWHELTRFADWVRRTGGNPIPYRAEAAQKISFPVVNLLMVVLGLALGANRRQTTLWAGFGYTVGLAFLYYLISDFGLELGRSGSIPVWLSAWSGNILYSGAGAFLFLRANR